MSNSDFVFVTYYWGTQNLNPNTQRPCPIIVKTVMNVAKVLASSSKPLSMKEIFKQLIRSGAISENEADNEVIDVKDGLRMLNKMGFKTKVVKGKIQYVETYDKFIKYFDNKDLMNGFIKTRRNPFNVLGNQKRGLGYHQDGSSRSLCGYKDCYQFPFTFGQMINKWKSKLDKLGIQNYAEEYTTAPRDLPKSKSIKGLYDFRTSQEGMNYKGEFILKMVNKFKKPVVYLDGDMLVHKYPTLFDSKDYDFMLRHWEFDPMDFLGPDSFSPKRFETSGGIMYFNNTPRSKNVLKGWISLNKKIMKKGEPGADDRILTMYLHKSKQLYSCRWLPIPTTYLWLTDKYSMSMFHGNILPQKLKVVIDHPNCLTTEEMAKDAGAIMNSGGARYPIDYFKYVSGNSLPFPFKDNSRLLNTIKNDAYKKRLQKLLLQPDHNKLYLNETYGKTDVLVNIKEKTVTFKKTSIGQAIAHEFNGKNAKEFMKWLDNRPFTWMSSRIEILN